MALGWLVCAQQIWDTHYQVATDFLYPNNKKEKSLPAVLLIK